MRPAAVSPTARVAMFVAALLLVTSCGASTDDPEVDGVDTTQDAGPSVANARFDGEFVATTVTIDGQDLDLASTPIVIFETRFGALTVNPGCNTYFGSFTLAEDGDASFTIAGGSKQNCGDLNAQEELVLQALSDANSWSESPGGFTFDGQDSSMTVISA